MRSLQTTNDGNHGIISLNIGKKARVLGEWEGTREWNGSIFTIKSVHAEPVECVGVCVFFGRVILGERWNKPIHETLIVPKCYSRRFLSFILKLSLSLILIRTHASSPFSSNSSLLPTRFMAHSFFSVVYFGDLYLLYYWCYGAFSDII